MKEKEPYKIVTLPSSHLEAEGPHYGPLGTKDNLEAEQRRERPAGSLTLENQRNGLMVASLLGMAIDRIDDGGFTADTLAKAGINTAWYAFVQSGMNVRRQKRLQVMNKQIRLPELARVEDNGELWLESREEFVQKIRKNLAVSAKRASDIFTFYTSRNRVPVERTDVLGKKIGATSLELAALPLFDNGLAGDAFDVQDAVRDTSLQLLADARSMARSTGSYPSMAQLADRDSDLSVYWRKEAPKQAEDALDAAQTNISNTKFFVGK